MPSELAPYTLATFMLAFFSLVTTQLRYRWSGSLVLLTVLALMLVLNGVHLATIPLIEHRFDLEFTVNGWIHWLLVLPLPGLLAYAAYHALSLAITSDP